MAERVDKGWQAKGIDVYSTEAILGTLGHYGVTVDEAGFKAAAATEFPLSIALGWHERWKGTGQFSRFPAAAAEELWRRLCAGRVAPTDVALALIKLLTALNGALEGTPDDGTRDTRFAVVEAYLPTLPTAPELREKFVAEMAGALGEWMEPFDRLAEALARRGQRALAERLVAVEEALFPIRAGAARSLVKAGAGDVDGAAAELRALADDAARDPFNRLAAVDALVDLGRFDDALRGALAVVDVAERDRSTELGAEVVERLAALLKAAPDLRHRDDLRERVERLAAALNPAPESGPAVRGR
jgi:hypothetical protein